MAVLSPHARRNVLPTPHRLPRPPTGTGMSIRCGNLPSAALLPEALSLLRDMPSSKHGCGQKESGSRFPIWEVRA